MTANNMDLKFPNQIFINNEFVDAALGGTFTTVNPADETAICQVASATQEDVDYAVHCAKVTNNRVSLHVRATHTNMSCCRLHLLIGKI